MSYVRATADELRTAVSDEAARFGLEADSTWRHNTTGAVVAVIALALREEDCATEVVYEHAGIVWTRMLRVFLDRFTRCEVGQ